MRRVWFSWGSSSERVFKEMTPVEENELTNAQSYLDYWRPQLRLDHIDFEIVLENAEEAGDYLANCKIAFGHHRQKIKLRHPNERTERDREIFRRDPEVVVVHELLHTKEMLWRDHPSIDEVFKKDVWLKGLHEDSLDAVAEALVRARRGMRR